MPPVPIIKSLIGHGVLFIMITYFSKEQIETLCRSFENLSATH